MYHSPEVFVSPACEEFVDNYMEVTVLDKQVSTQVSVYLSKGFENYVSSIRNRFKRLSDLYNNTQIMANFDNGRDQIMLLFKSDLAMRLTKLSTVMVHDRATALFESFKVCLYPRILKLPGELKALENELIAQTQLVEQEKAVEKPVELSSDKKTSEVVHQVTEPEVVTVTPSSDKSEEDPHELSSIEQEPLSTLEELVTRAEDLTVMPIIEEQQPMTEFQFPPQKAKKKQSANIGTTENPEIGVAREEHKKKLNKNHKETLLKVFAKLDYDSLTLRELVSLADGLGGTIKSTGRNRCRIELNHIYAGLLIDDSSLPFNATSTVTMHGGGHRSTKSQNHDRGTARSYLVQQFKAAFERSGFTPELLWPEEYSSSSQVFYTATA